MGPSSHLRHAWRRLWRRHGQTIGLCLIVLAVMVAMGLVIWFLSDMRFQVH